MTHPAHPDSLLGHRDRVLKCLNDNLSTAAMLGMAWKGLEGAAKGARDGAMAGAPFDGVGAGPGALVGGFAGGVTGAAAGGLGGELGSIGGCLIRPQGVKPK